MKGTDMTVEPSIKQVDPDSAEGVLLRRLLEEERMATVNHLKFRKKAEEWEKYRADRRAAIRRIMGAATTVKIGELPAVVSEPKDQFSGKAFAAEYPTLHEEYTLVQAVKVLDVERLRQDHPDIAAKFTVSTFLNRLA
jgi:hypothetical protein